MNIEKKYIYNTSKNVQNNQALQINYCYKEGNFKNTDPLQFTEVFPFTKKKEQHYVENAKWNI